MPNIDHFVFFHPNLKDGIAYFEENFGLKAEIGGQHLGRGTWNAIFALESNAYFEIISPDPKQMAFNKARWMGIDHFAKPQLIRWAVAVESLKETATKANSFGLQIGNIEEGNRQLSNGEMLQWQLTTPAMHEQVEPIPFFIEWAVAVHPSKDKEPQASISKVVLHSPDANNLKNRMSWLDLDIEFIKSDTPKIYLELEHQTKIISIS